MGRRGANYPHPVPNPALAEGAALDAQLIAQFRSMGTASTTGTRSSKRSRSTSPWNHTYMEIDLRQKGGHHHQGQQRLDEGLEDVVDPVYEEIERPCRGGGVAGGVGGGVGGGRGQHRHRHYVQGSSDVGSDEEPGQRRQNSDVSRQSSRSYGDNRPLIPASTPASSASVSAADHADLLTTISCAFNSPHLPRASSKHRANMAPPPPPPPHPPHPHPHPHGEPASVATPIHMGFDAAPSFDADRYAERPLAPMPFTEC